jgi:hypothetical protein
MRPEFNLLDAHYEEAKAVGEDFTKLRDIP